MNFLKKNWSNILFIVVIILLIIPQTRKPIQIGLNRLIAFSPSEISEGERENLDNYNWRLRSLDGETHYFSEIQGEVAIVNLWATWCPPCIAEMPSFQKLYEEYGDKVNFYFISSEDVNEIKPFLDKNAYVLPVFLPLSSPPEKLQSRSLPTTFVISRSGEIVVNKKGSANWDDYKFKKLLDKLLEEEL